MSNLLNRVMVYRSEGSRTVLHAVLSTFEASTDYNAACELAALTVVSLAGSGVARMGRDNAFSRTFSCGAYTATVEQRANVSTDGCTTRC